MKLEKSKIFVSHAGGNSYLEAVEFGIPIIGHPLSDSDQLKICESAQDYGFGYCLKTITS